LTTAIDKGTIFNFQYKIIVYILHKNTTLFKNLVSLDQLYRV